jgi:hypothetical protein
MKYNVYSKNGKDWYEEGDIGLLFENDDEFYKWVNENYKASTLIKNYELSNDELTDCETGNSIWDDFFAEVVTTPEKFGIKVEEEEIPDPEPVNKIDSVLYAQLQLMLGTYSKEEIIKTLSNM